MVSFIHWWCFSAQDWSSLMLKYYNYTLQTALLLSAQTCWTLPADRVHKCDSRNFISTPADKKTKRANTSNLHFSNIRVEVFRSWHGDSCLLAETFLATLHTLTVLVWPLTLQHWVVCFFFCVSEMCVTGGGALSHVLLFLTFFSSSWSPAPRRVKMMPVWELRPTADTTILPDPSITWVPEERLKRQLKL